MAQVSPLGALLRYRLGLQNRRSPTFPAFTLAANLSACAALAGLQVPFT